MVTAQSIATDTRVSTPFEGNPGVCAMISSRSSIHRSIGTNSPAPKYAKTIPDQARYVPSMLP
jgi:hypothetical protein